MKRFPSLLASAFLLLTTASLFASPSHPQKGFAYPLTTCAVSGEALGSMGDPIVATFAGREVRFCCDRCPQRFEKDVAAGLARLDEKVIADQKPLYPLESSVVSGEKLGETPYEFVHGNRLIRLADESEKGDFTKNAETYLAKLDKAVAERQSKAYALTTCPVEGAKLDGGKAENLVFAGRLIRVCCANCKKSVLEDPAAALLAVVESQKGAAAEKPKKETGSK